MKRKWTLSVTQRKWALSIILSTTILTTVVWLLMPPIPINLPESIWNFFHPPPEKEPLLIPKTELNETLSGKILYEARNIQTGKTYLYIINASGEDGIMTRPTKISSDIAYPTWSPDGKKIAFSSGRDNEDLNINSSIFVINADGTNRTRLTFNSWGDFNPVWSPDGKKIAFFGSDEEGNTPWFHIYVVNADGSNQRRLTKDLVVLGTPRLSWSPDSKRITYGSEGNSEGNIYVVDLNGNTTKLAENAGTANYNPAWSPDGKKIVYVGWSQLNGGAIYTINPDGSSQIKLTTGNIRGADELIWSPDGTKIAFICPPDVSSLDLSVWILNATGGKPIRVSKAYGYIVQLVWSPDSKWIAFGAEANIHVAKADGTIEIQLTDDESSTHADWSSN